MKKHLFFALLLIAGAGLGRASAQTTDKLPDAFGVSGAPVQATTAASAGVTADPRIAQLIEKQVYINTLALRNMPGFRVQVISTMDRSKANAAKAKLMELFPQYGTYLSYQSPYFRVRIGDFRNQQDAEGLQQQLNTYFPNGVFTVRDVIHISPEQLFQNPDNDSDN